MKLMKNSDTNTERIVFLDYLRFIACFMVMTIHACEPFYLGGTEPNVTSIASVWDMLWITITECVCRVCVPLFVIASSYLLFPVNRQTGEFFRRRLARVAVPFLVWSALYVAFSRHGLGAWGRMLFNFPDEGGHLWFVPMLLGLYILMPLLSPWAERVGEKELRGWIVLWLATTLFPFLRQIWGALFGDPSFGAVPYLYGECPWNGFGAFHYVSGFIGYMLIGLWFRKFAPRLDRGGTLKVAIPLWIAGVAIIGVPFFLRVRQFPFAAPYSFAVVMETSIEYCSLGVALATVAAFMVLRRFEFGGWLYKWVVGPVAKASFGMYLMHMFILNEVFAALSPRLPTPLTIVLTATATFSLSAVAALVLRRVPFVGRWLCG